MELWGGFRRLLATRRCLVAYDPRGTGRSSAAPVGVTTRDLAEDAARLLEHLAVARADVFGLSLGGMTAEWLAIDAPEKVARLVLASTTAHGLDFVHAGVRKGLAIAKSFLSPDESAEANLLLRVLSARFRRRHPNAVARIERPVLAHPASRIELLKHAAAGARHDARDRVGDIRAPTRVLAGACDTLLGLDAQRRLADAIPGASFEVIPDAGHDITLEQPALSAERVLAFFAGAAG